MTRIVAAAAAGFIVAVIVAGSHYDNTLAAQGGEPLPAAMAGNWAGDADIFVNWTAQRALPVKLSIAADGTVSGTIGDALLRNGRLQRNRTALGRALHVKTDWIVIADLDGDVIKAESIRRESVKVPLNWVDDHFEGGVNTSGSEFGGKTSMWLAAGRLRLDRRSAHAQKS
ncbi:MAG TPA: hypothetical protein VL225_12705 [Vicinamibacterales bacterium]|nr:hypothetical protein [Vicinamibacterales bacterium]